MKKDKIQNPEADIIIGKISHKYMYWAVFVVLSIFTTLIIFSTIVKYPESFSIAIILKEDSSTNKKIIGEAQVTADEVARIENFEKVIVRLNAYPYTEYGIIEVKMKQANYDISSSFYNIIIEFPRDLKTSTGKEIPFREGLKGDCVFIKKDRTLFNVISAPIKKMFLNY